MKGLSISITLLTCIRVVSPVQNGEMIFMLMWVLGDLKGAISDVAHTALIINPLQPWVCADLGRRRMCLKRPKECVPAGS